MYDPKAHGALCERCPLNGHRVVPPEGPLDAHFAVVGEAPGEEEERQGRPFIGPSGETLDDALRAAGTKRRDVLITNTLLCRPPGNELKVLLQQVNKQNRKLEQEYENEKVLALKEDRPAPEKPDLIQSPLDCCAPRLKKELANIKNRITLGKTATNVLTGSSAGILQLRGGVIELDDPDVEGGKLKTMPTVHPAFALRQRRWLHVLLADINKAILWFDGMANWEPPLFVWNPTADELEGFIQTSDVFAYDLETDGIEPLEARIRCICIATPQVVYVVSFLGKDGSTRFYTSPEEVRILAVIKRFLLNPDITKVGHNILNYDTPVIKANWGIIPVNQVDTLLIHRNVESELPHGLAFVGTMYSLAPNWKVNKEGAKLSTEAKDDRELALYCANDGAVNIRVLPPLISRLQEREQVHIWEVDQNIQGICREMHEVGMWVHQPTRLAQEKKMLDLRFKVLSKIRDFVGNKDFNPGSIRQLQGLLFDRWGLDPQIDKEEKYTGTAQKLENFTWEGISTGDLILRALLCDPAVPEDKRAFIKLIRRYRKLMKLLGTYVCKLRYSSELNDLGWDEEDEDGAATLAAWNDTETRKRYGIHRMGIVNPRTGRMHPGYSAGVAVTGRLASSRPINAQNFPSALRKMVHAAPGHVLVGADMDQLELRIAAAVWQVALYLRAFAEGKDPHSMTAFAIFGERFCKAAQIDPKQFRRDYTGIFIGGAYDEHGGFDKDKASADSIVLRHLGKTTQYASQYMGSDETVHKVIQKTEVPAVDKNGKPLDDGTTDLPYARQTLKETRRMRKAWLDGAPEFAVGWEHEINEFNNQGFLVEPVMGRRRDFLDGIEKDANAVVNFKIQCVPGNTRVLVDRGYVPISELIGQRFQAWTGKKWAPATCISKGFAELRPVRTDRNVEFLCDPTHKLLTVGTAAYEWRPISNIKQNTRVALAIAEPLEFGESLDPEDAYILGLWLADGSASPHSKREVDFSIVVGNTAKTGSVEMRSGTAQIERITRWAISRGMSPHLHDDIGCVSVGVTKGGQAWLESMGADVAWRSATKRIPERVWRSSLQARKAFLTGFLDGDAYQEPQGSVLIHLCQRKLLEELWLLFRTVGVDSQAIYGPYVQGDATSYRISLSGSMVFRELGWGRDCKLYGTKSGNSPKFICNEVKHNLKATCASDRVIKSRLHRHANSTTNPYVLQRMGCTGLYDHATVTSVGERRVQVEVFTLSVDDPDHQYIANGFVSKNSAAASIVNKIMSDLHGEVPFEKWGPGTGIINQCHDSIVIECPADGVTFDEKGKPHGDPKALPFRVAALMDSIMNREEASLPGVKFSTKAKVGRTWKDV